MSDLILDRSFKVKLGRANILVPISCLLLVLEVGNVESSFRKPCVANLLVMSDLTLDHNLKVKLGWGQHISAYILLIIGSRGF